MPRLITRAASGKLWARQSVISSPTTRRHGLARPRLIQELRAPLRPPGINLSLEVNPMNLGSFSISLAVKNLEKSRAFYAKLGFQPVGGQEQENWLILRNGDHVIGLFQGMFDKNILTFNPGWDQSGAETDPFTDVRQIQSELEKQGVELTSQADTATTGPASLVLTDPDGNQILIDQHR